VLVDQDDERDRKAAKRWTLISRANRMAKIVLKVAY
jgi:hypothetical protein